MSEGVGPLGVRHERKPGWLKRPLPQAGSQRRMEALLRQRGLHTVCESASCPNMGSCFAQGTATFLIMGDVCTRSCRFCGVETGSPLELDPEEPARVAEVAAELGLNHVVVTSVTRDDLRDGGAGHYVETIGSIRARSPRSTVEVLIPDFGGRWESLDAVLDSVPEVLNHNVETIPRLYDTVRPQADYQRSLDVLRRAAADAGCAVKTGFMVGLGESGEEVEALLADLAEVGVDMVTIGQYLQPRLGSVPVSEYVRPEVFEHYRGIGAAKGLLVQSGPFVRSSYQARESFAEVAERRGKSFGVELQ